MTQPDAPKPPNAVQYAQDTLGVHDVHNEANAALAALGAAQNTLNAATSEIRSLHEALADRETDLTMAERASNADMSQTAFDKYIKQVVQKDRDHADLRDTLVAAQNRRDDAEAQVRQAEMRIRIATARMEELGGLLAFYAAAKSK